MAFGCSINNMNEKQTVRPTKKQRELLGFIETFIAEHGYSPSYREIMNGLGYTSVATVSLHVNNLIRRGHLRKRDYSARSLEVVSQNEAVAVTSNEVSASEEKWLVSKVEHVFTQAEGDAIQTPDSIADLMVLVRSLQLLGLDGAAQSFVSRLSELKKNVKELTTVT